MTMVAPQGNDATLTAAKGRWRLGGGKSSGMTMKETTGNKDYRQRQ
jgi:hypothetical protein